MSYLYTRFERVKTAVVRSYRITERTSGFSFDSKKNPSYTGCIIFTENPKVENPDELEIFLAAPPSNPWELLEWPKRVLPLEPEGVPFYRYHRRASYYGPEQVALDIVPYESILATIHPQTGVGLKIGRRAKSPEKIDKVWERGEAIDRPAVMDYAEYLQSETWAAKRAEVKKRSGGMCELCAAAGVRRLSSDVHHLRYPNVLGEEPINDLLDICRPHHSQLHGLGAVGMSVTFSSKNNSLINLPDFNLTGRPSPKRNLPPNFWGDDSE